ncbi:hydrolase or acyltransferase [Vibrio campbellii]|uniref:alpha/beta fold hydrolase n=1 Tax=Vibrio campbellii TaxID=680 RepID=UPI0005314649|nr:alpha/beta hydrolase [Vibrio campbellii]KGR36582.1 hydrolase or acyltransferase [Vibrio campbellii]
MMIKSPLVLIHGFLSGPQYWRDQVAAMSAHLDVITICLKGFSHRSDETAASSIEEFAQDVMDQLDEIGVEQFHLLGHSMGGMIAQQIAHQYSRRLLSLVLYGTGPKGHLPGRFEHLDESIAKASTDNYQSSVVRAVKSWFKYEERSQKEIEASLALIEKVQFESYLNGLKSMRGWNGESYLKSYSMPCLVLWGDCDRSYPWDPQPFMLWRTITNCSLSVIPDCAHNVHLEKPDVFNLIVLDFLIGLEESREL